MRRPSGPSVCSLMNVKTSSSGVSLANRIGTGRSSAFMMRAFAAATLFEEAGNSVTTVGNLRAKVVQEVVGREPWGRLFVELRAEDQDHVACAEECGPEPGSRRLPRP